MSIGNEVPLEAQWAVVRTKPQQERFVVKHLVDREIEPYCPLYQQPVWHVRAPRGPVALFPGYVFARWYCDADISLVRFCPGVRYAVSFGGRLATVEQRFIEALRLREGERGYILPEALETGLNEGCFVTIMAGPLMGAEGVFTGYVNGLERARVLIEILRRPSNVEVPIENLAMRGKINGSDGRSALRARR